MTEEQECNEGAVVLPWSANEFDGLRWQSWLHFAQASSLVLSNLEARSVSAMRF